jgi:hypothetical protein
VVRRSGLVAVPVLTRGLVPSVIIRRGFISFGFVGLGFVGLRWPTVKAGGVDAGEEEFLQ